MILLGDFKDGYLIYLSIITPFFVSVALGLQVEQFLSSTVYLKQLSKAGIYT